MTQKFVLRLCLIGVLALSALILSACAPAATPTEAPIVEVVVDTPVPPTQAPTPEPVDQSMYVAEWESGPHAAPYDLGKGPNTMCSRCHSPQNWIPGSKTGPPPNCVTCKFPTDAELRIAPSFAEGGMDLVTEDEWVGIPCETCHEVDSDGVASSELSWLVPIELTREKINSPNELCTKCHTSPAGTKTGSQGLAADHWITLGGSAHMNYAGEWPQADRPKYCIDCHNAHTGETKQCVDCHVDTADTHTKVSAMMETVTCMACHDASGSILGQRDDGTYSTFIMQAGGRPGSEPTPTEIISHSIVYYVACDRCHFEGNEFELTVLTASGQVPSDDAGAGGPP